MEIRLEIENSDEIIALLEKFPQIAQEELTKSMEEFLNLLNREIKEATPVVTNVLRSSIHSRLGVRSISGSKSGALSDEVIGVVGTSINMLFLLNWVLSPFQLVKVNILGLKVGKCLQILWKLKTNKCKQFFPKLLIVFSIGLLVQTN